VNPEPLTNGQFEALTRFDPAKATFDARTLSPADVIHSIEQFGCAWLKGLFDPTELKTFDAVIATKIYREDLS
jgi:hypothetical protein